LIEGGDIMFVCRHNNVWIISDSHTIVQAPDDDVYTVDVHAKYLNWRIESGQMVTDVGIFDLKPLEKTFISVSKTTVEIGEVIEIKVTTPAQLIIEGKDTAAIILVDDKRVLKFSKSGIFQIYAQDKPSNVVKVVVSSSIIEEVI